MANLKKNDTVVVIAGKDKGKTGRIIRVMSREDKILIENINLVKKAQRPTQQNQQGGFVDIERPIHRSNVMLIDKKTNKPTRLGVKINKDGSKFRVSRKSGERI